MREIDWEKNRWRNKEREWERERERERERHRQTDIETVRDKNIQLAQDEERNILHISSIYIYTYTYRKSKISVQN